MLTPRNTIEGSGIKRDAENTHLFDQRRERHAFEEARREFVGEQYSYSREQPKVRECEMPPVFDQSSIAKQRKEVSKLVDFLYTCINLIKDENIV
jgi:hypothetical protein